MLYYRILPSGLNLKPLTYRSNFKIPNFTQVLVNIKNKKTLGYVLQNVVEPDFKTLEILEILPAVLTPIQISLLKFISHYYVVNLSVAAGLFTPLEIGAPLSPFFENLADKRALGDKNELNVNLNLNAKFDDSTEQNSTTEFDEISQSNLSQNLNNGGYRENLIRDISMPNFDFSADLFDISQNKATARKVLKKNLNLKDGAVYTVSNSDNLAYEKKFTEKPNLGDISDFESKFGSLGNPLNACLNQADTNENSAENLSLNDGIALSKANLNDDAACEPTLHICARSLKSNSNQSPGSGILVAKEIRSKTLNLKSNPADLVQSEIFSKIPNLNSVQQEALNFTKSHKTSLIFGDTGSGKSEIYFSLIREYLLLGKQVLFLMPEISLTPQMTKRLKSYFGEKFGVWHSKITPKKRGEILRKFQSREINLIAGARSALFLPFSELGLIIVDEEHDDSYKSAQNPHYNARDLALFLAGKFDVKVVLGSATPSVVSFKKQPSFRLRGTFFKSEKRFIYDESETGLSDIVLGELGASFESGKQAVVFLPTRANFRYLACRECANTIKCPFCSVGMSFYKKRNLLKCQYCGFTMPVARECDKCGSEMIEAKKIGTDELTDALRSAFPAARIEKFDRDEITTQNKLEKTLAAFNAGEIDALVGTQMLSKGHDYHNVGLAVIMGVDELLNFPDFRARERTLALSMQVAGRAGRSGEGRVVVQSRQREFFENFIEDYDAFLAEEIAAREPLYPPFARLLRAVVADKSEQSAKQKLEACMAELDALRVSEPDLQIVGHGKCAIEILGGKFRFEILLRCIFYASLIKAARICATHGFDVDMDPINFS